MDKNNSLRLVFALAFLALLPGLFHLQVISYERFHSLSENNSTRTIYLDIPRGRILDRRGRVLAEDRVGYNLSFIPFDIGNRAEQAERLAAILEKESREILEHFQRQYPNPFEPRILARDLGMEQMHRLEENMHLLRGMTIQPGLVRHYPLGPAAAHLLGYLGEVDREELQSLRGEKVRMGDLVGRSGMERAHDSFLRGERGGMIVEVDARGRRVRELGHQESRPGGDIVLNIDLDLQRLAAEKLGSRTGSVIAICPDTGEVLALVSGPSFDPSRPADFLGRPNYPFLNRALQAQYPPGSVFKVVTALAGIESGIIKTMDSPRQEFIRSIRDPLLRREMIEDDIIRCEGYIEVGDRRFHCWREEGHGWVGLREAMALSCNIYFGRVGMDVGILRLLDAASRIGLGVPTGIDLPGEREGLVPQPRYSGGALNISIGQGTLLTTPVQLASMMATVANEGNIMRPWVLREKRTPAGEVTERQEPRVSRHFFTSRPVLEMVKQSLVAVVESGTATRAAVPGMTVGGKTGTAQLARRESGISARALFACWTESPGRPLAVVTVLDRATWGAEAAAPTGELLRAYYRLLGPEPGEPEPGEPDDPEDSPDPADEPMLEGYF